MANLKQLLTELASLDGVSAAVVVSRDGFVIESASSKQGIDHDALGAVVSSTVGATESLGKGLGLGDLTNVMTEYSSGIVVVNALGEVGALAIVADVKANVGNIRYNAKKRASDIEAAL